MTIYIWYHCQSGEVRALVFEVEFPCGFSWYHTSLPLTHWESKINSRNSGSFLARSVKTRSWHSRFLSPFCIWKHSTNCNYKNCASSSLLKTLSYFQRLNKRKLDLQPGAHLFLVRICFKRRNGCHQPPITQPLSYLNKIIYSTQSSSSTFDSDQVTIFICDML